MPRIYRVVLPGCPHHVTQRGNFRQIVYHDDEDLQTYVRFLEEYSLRYSMEIWSYCLMPNHVHIIAVPKHANSLALALNQAHMRYSQYSNQRRGRQGHVWQGRFYSSILGEEHLFRAVRYVERNPVRAGLVLHAADYPWSSARAHVLGVEDPLVSVNCPLLKEVTDWKAFVSEADEIPWMESLRRSARSGYPLGTEEFVARVGEILGRPLSPRRSRPGRPSTAEEARLKEAQGRERALPPIKS